MITYTIRDDTGGWNVYSSAKNNGRIMIADKEVFSLKSIVWLIDGNHRQMLEGIEDAEIKMKKDGTLETIHEIKS